MQKILLSSHMYQRCANIVHYCNLMQYLTQGFLIEKKYSAYYIIRTHHALRVYNTFYLAKITLIKFRFPLREPARPRIYIYMQINLTEDILNVSTALSAAFNGKFARISRRVKRCNFPAIIHFARFFPPRWGTRIYGSRGHRIIGYNSENRA